MKKAFLIASLFFLIMASQVQAAGLVPCGGAGEEACKFCHFFVLTDKILDFVLVKMVPVIAVLMLTIGGVMYFFAGGSPTMLGQAKGVITSTFIGLAIIFSAFLIVGTILSAIGLTDWTQDIYKNWWQEGFFQVPGC